MAPRITPQKRAQILVLLAEGLTQPKIAERLGVGERSVRRERAKLTMRERASAGQSNASDAGRIVRRVHDAAEFGLSGASGSPAYRDATPAVSVDAPLPEEKAPSAVVRSRILPESQLAEARAEGARSVVPLAEAYVSRIQLQATEATRVLESELGASEAHAGRLQRTLDRTSFALLTTDQERLAWAERFRGEQASRAEADDRGDFFLEKAAQFAIERDQVQARAKALERELRSERTQSQLLSRIFSGVRGMLAGSNSWDADVLAVEWNKVSPQNRTILCGNIELAVQRSIAPVLRWAANLAAVMTTAVVDDNEASEQLGADLADLLRDAEVLGSAASEIVVGVVGVSDHWIGVQGPASELESALISLNASFAQRLADAERVRVEQEQVALRAELAQEDAATYDILTAVRSCELNDETARALRAHVDAFNRRQQASLSRRMSAAVEDRYRALDADLNRAEHCTPLDTLPSDLLAALERVLSEWTAVFRYRPVAWPTRLDQCRERVAVLTARYEREDAARREKEVERAKVLEQAIAERDGRWAAMGQRPRSEQFRFIVRETAPSLLRLGLEVILAQHHKADRQSGGRW